MKIAVLKETFPAERRVSLIPASVGPLIKAGCSVIVESNAGLAAGFPDSDYVAKGAEIVSHRAAAFDADVVVAVRWLGANPIEGQKDLEFFRPGQFMVGTCDPLGNPAATQLAARAGVVLLGLELIPRITRAQSMDVLSSMAMIAGYRAVLLAAVELPRMFPLMMTAAGTVSPARVFVIGAGVAGLQAIASARRLGAVVQAYDVRPAVREQCQSLGAKFVQLDLKSDHAEDRGGYAKSLGEEFYAKQRQFMADVVAENDVVITTAAIPGKPSPLLVTAEAVRRMPIGSVIVDLAAERGGNCELSRPDQKLVYQERTILAPTNLPAEVPYHASLMFSKNVTTFLLHLLKQGRIELDLTDEITRQTLITRDGEVVHAQLQELLQSSDAGDRQSTNQT